MWLGVFYLTLAGLVLLYPTRETGWDHERKAKKEKS